MCGETCPTHSAMSGCVLGVSSQKVEHNVLGLCITHEGLCTYCNTVYVLQSCRRNLSTVGKPVIIPGLPELAGLVGNMAAQWEAQAQQQAMQMETAEGAAEEGVAANESITDTAVAVQTPAANGVDSTSEAGQNIESRTDTAGVSGAVEADEGPAVDASADAALPDMVGDMKASQRVAGVTTASAAAPAGTADAAEARRQKKQKAVATD